MAEKAEINVEGQTSPIYVMFNPTEYTVAALAQTTGEGANIQFQQVTVEDFTITLFFDTYEKKKDVRKEIDAIAALVMPTVEGRETKKPPLCRFVWGSFGYKGIVTKISQKFIMFLSTGVPVRAEVAVTFKAVITSREDAEFKGKEACRKMWRVKSGDRLDRIAFQELKNASAWRKIAHANNIMNPLAFPTDDDIGTLLVIPD